MTSGPLARTIIRGAGPTALLTATIVSPASIGLFSLSPVLGGEGWGEGRVLAIPAPHSIPLPRVRGRGDQSAYARRTCLRLIAPTPAVSFALHRFGFLLELRDLAG